MRKANQADRNFFKKNGYIIFKSVLNPQECDLYIKAAHRAVTKITVTPNLYRKSKKILELLQNPKILNLADTLLGWRMIPIGDIFFFSKAQNKLESGSVPHQDSYGQRAEYGAFMACGVALDNATEENGALRIYPGTHKLGDLRSNPKKNFEIDAKGNIIKALPIGNNCIIPKGYKEKIVELNKGDILFFHAHVVHYAKKNVSKKKEYKYRRICYVKYIKNGYAFWPGWTEKRTLIERLDNKHKGPLENSIVKV